MQADLREFDAADFKGVDLVSGGLPCPPFSVAGKQLGETDDRNLFPAAIRVIEQVRPRAVMIENVRGILDAVFVDYRKFIAGELPLPYPARSFGEAVVREPPRDRIRAISPGTADPGRRLRQKARGEIYVTEFSDCALGEEQCPI